MKTCENCKQPLRRKPNERAIDFAKRRFCNRKCAGAFRAGRTRDPDRKITAKCEFSGAIREKIRGKVRRASSGCGQCDYCGRSGLQVEHCSVPGLGLIPVCQTCRPYAAGFVK